MRPEAAFKLVSSSKLEGGIRQGMCPDVAQEQGYLLVVDFPPGLQSWGGGVGLKLVNPEGLS